MTDEDHIRYMFDGGQRRMIERLWKTKDDWGFSNNASPGRTRRIACE